MKKILIVTGGSKGIGEGIVKAYLEDHFQVFSIARTANPSLSRAGVTQIELDLTHIEQIETTLAAILNEVAENNPTKITLVNNAGTLGQIAKLENLPAADLMRTFQLNTVAPAVCCAAFMKLTKDWDAEKTIINITSGAALKPYFGWSAYCSSKAALNMLSQTMALEQEDQANAVRVLAIAPGVVDTDMQSEIRSADEANFKSLNRFLALKEEGGLSDPKMVGRKIWAMDHDRTLVSGSVLRVES